MTTAITPQASNHAGLPDLASRFVKVDDLPWEPTTVEGVETKTLLFEKASGLLTVIMKMAPGAALPDHAHMQIEQTFVLEGRLVCGEGECLKGDFVWRPAGSRHKAWCPEGGVMLASFQVPNKFFVDGAERDILGQDWNAVWGKCTNFAALAS
ncbi:MAG: cupin domain-containing protein [Rhodospirillales bacterium]|nr:cupin domain-containing protein [Rhodospirillales bacterium]